jgi:hypothetical protein
MMPLGVEVAREHHLPRALEHGCLFTTREFRDKMLVGQAE